MPPGVDAVCGGCRIVIPGDHPIALVTSRNLVRCEMCARQMGFEVNAQEVDLERFRLEQARQQSAAPERPRQPVLRIMPPQQVRPASLFADVHDPRAKAAGE